MGIWKASSVSATPEIVLNNWKVYELTGTRPTRHFVGYNETEREGRVSTAIVSFDQSTLTGKTQSGRTYCLVGPSCQDPDGEYVWRNWTDWNEVEYKDVSDEYAKND